MMTPQLIAFVAACKKAEIKAPLRALIAHTLQSAIQSTNHDLFKDNPLERVLNKTLFEAMTLVGFDFKVASDDLVQPEERYEQINHAIAICCHVAAAPGELMDDLSAVFKDDHWAIWEFLHQLTDEALGELHSRYSALGRSDKLEWARQKSSMGEVKKQTRGSRIR